MILHSWGQALDLSLHEGLFFSDAEAGLHFSCAGVKLLPPPKYYSVSCGAFSVRRNVNSEISYV
ncbi:MAG: hypothetical protein ACRCTL_09405, partial [Pseudomonas sp.]